KEELAANGITVVDLTKIKAGDNLHHTKFAESPEIVRLIGSRLSSGQTLTDSRLGLGDHIVAATAGAAHTVGTAAGLVVAAPAAIVDQNTRRNYVHHVEALAEPSGATR
ncbi:alpha/beta hydrolase, partial [Sinorhizobium meliloti]